jgi:hypothetical protein
MIETAGARIGLIWILLLDMIRLRASELAKAQSGDSPSNMIAIHLSMRLGFFRLKIYNDWNADERGFG